MSASASAASRWFERARVALLAADISWTTLCLGGYMPGTKAVMAVLTGALIAVHLVDPSRRPAPHPAGWLFVPFLAYAAANLAWVSPDRWIGWFDVLNWAQMVAVFWIVLNGVRSPGCRRFLCGFLVVLGVVAAVLAAYQHFFDPHWLMLGRHQHAQFIGRATGPFGIPNSLGVLMALLIPPVGALAVGRGRPAVLRILSALALAALVVGFVLAISRGAWIALAGAFALRPLVVPGRSLGRRIGAALAAVAVAAAVVATLYLSFPMMHERVDDFVRDVGERTRPIVWRGAWRIFEAHPALGGGSGCFDVLFEAYRPEGFSGRSDLRPLRLPEHASRLRCGRVRPLLRARGICGLAVRPGAGTCGCGMDGPPRVLAAPPGRLSSQDTRPRHDRRHDHRARRPGDLAGRCRSGRGRPRPIEVFPCRRMVCRRDRDCIHAPVRGSKVQGGEIQVGRPREGRQDCRIGSRPVEPEGRSHGGKRWA